MRWLSLVLFVCLAGSAAAWALHISIPTSAPEGHWSHLSKPQYISPVDGAIYYSFALENGTPAHLVVVDLRSGNWRIRPALAQPTTQPTSVVAARENASAATNGGYFNLKGGGASTSYVVIDGKTVADPTTNKILTENPKLQPFLERILNRSEVRFLVDAQGKRTIQITRHETPPAPGMKLIDSLQAGPQLLPTVESIDEAFIRTNPDGTDADSISARKEAARTAFGVTADGYALMLCVPGKGQDPESSGISLENLAALMRRLGCVQAINLDGGASTTMYVRLAGSDGAAPPAGTVVCGKTPETLVKSVLLLEPTGKNTVKSK